MDAWCLFDWGCYNVLNLIINGLSSKQMRMTRNERRLFNVVLNLIINGLSSKLDDVVRINKELEQVLNLIINGLSSKQERFILVG